MSPKSTKAYDPYSGQTLMISEAKTARIIHGLRWSIFALAFASSIADGQTTNISSPYETVDWSTIAHHRADLHVHTLQSDGCHHPVEVVTAFAAAGFAILSLTDHDAVAPNLCPTRATATPAQMQLGVFVEEHSPYPRPMPENFPANTTWPWDEFGAPSPKDLGMLGIEGSELTCGHHLSAFFSDYGVQPPCRDAPALSAQLHEVARRQGVAFINHPEARFKEWYAELLRYHSADYLVGIEVSRGVEDATALWDQLLSELMPSRKIWAFATSDMHLLQETQFGFTVFLLNDSTADAVKRAMQDGTFYSVVGPQSFDIREAGKTAYTGTYPALRSIFVDHEALEIIIDAEGYDEIVWKSSPSSQQLTIDSESHLSWAPGEIVAQGPSFSIPDDGNALRYVRAEIIRQTEQGAIRVILNPIALAR